GGAMIKGDKSALRPLAARLVLHGFGVAAINYRLSPAVKFPAHVEDVAAAFAWIHANIRQHGGDPGRIFVAGGSAGGYLVALLSVDGRYLKKHGLGLDNIKGTVAISGLMNTAKVPKERLKLVWGGDPAVTRLASPMQYVSKDVPAMLILFADGDTAGRKQQNRHMANALKRAGHKDVSVKEMANRTHDSIREHMAEANDPGLNLMLGFMKRLAAP
ncbi:MAG: alpha/beta hydrolase, partial [Pirellulaceae bacterium]